MKLETILAVVAVVAAVLATVNLVLLLRLDRVRFWAAIIKLPADPEQERTQQRQRLHKVVNRQRRAHSRSRR